MTPQQIADRWNIANPIGTKVKIKGSDAYTVTRSPAMVLAKTTPVVFLNRINSPQMLSGLQVTQMQQLYAKIRDDSKSLTALCAPVLGR